VKGEQRQLSRIPLGDEPRCLARRRWPPERRHLTKGALDGSQILDELVSDEQRLAVEALNQLTQPIGLQAVDRNRIVIALVVEESIRDLGTLTGRDQRRDRLHGAPVDRGE